MRVALLGAKGDFTKKAADGVKRYMYELYTNLKYIDSINIKKIEFKNIPLLYQGFSPFPQSIIYNFKDYEIIHNLEPKPILPLNKGRALQVTTVHDFHGIIRPEKEDWSSLKRILGRYFVLIFGLKIALKKSDYLICNSTQTREEAISLGYNKNRIFVTPLGVDKRFISKRIRRKRGFFKIGYIGSMSATKNVSFAIRAVKLLKGNLLFDIWGKQDRTYNELRGLSINDKRIRFMGFAPESKLVDIYDSFDVFVHPSLYEGFGLPILEAQARGLPVIIYKYGKIPKEVRKYCFEAESPEHMAQIIENLKEDGYNEKERKKAMKYARSFTWEKTARETFEVYKKVLE